MSAYTDEQLIDLIRERSPQELSEGEIADLRRVMRRSPEVREALAAEVGVEQAVAMHYAPEAGASDAFVSQLDQILAERRRGWLWRVYGAAVVAVFVIGAFATSPYWLPSDDPSATNTLAQQREPEGGAGEPLATRVPEQAAASAEVDARAGEAEAAAATPAAAPIALDWRHYVDPVTVPGLWADDFAAGLVPIEKARWEPKEHRGENWVELDGSYRLTALPTPGRIVRLVFDARQALRIDAWSGRDGVRLRWDGKEQWTRQPITRAQTKQTEPDKPAEEVKPEPLIPVSRANVLPLDLGVKGEALTLSSADAQHARIALPGELTQVIVGYRGRVYLAQPRPAVVLPDAAEEAIAVNGPDTVEREGEGEAGESKAEAAGEAAGGDVEHDEEQARLQASLRDYELSIAEAKRGNLEEALRLLRRPDVRGANRDSFLREYQTRATRQLWYSLAAAGRWELLREDVLRRRAWAISAQGTLPNHQKDEPLIALGEWMLRRAFSATGDQLPGFEPTYYQHPLSVRGDRETESTLAEFEAAVSAQQPAQAARLLVASPLTDTLVAVGTDPDLLRSSHLLVRQTLRESPELRSIIAAEHEAVGRVRVGRAIAQDNTAALESLALQFYGSEPGIRAARYLADRELSLGKFLAAAERYQSLIDLPRTPEAELLNAKFRLAWAMMGEVRGEAVKSDVQLGDHRYRSKDFEAMISELAASHGVSTAGPETKTAGKPIAPGKLSVVHRATLPQTVDFGREAGVQLYAGPRWAAVARHDGALLMNLADGSTPTLAASSDKREKDAQIAPALRPLILDDGIILGWQRRDQVQLRRFDINGQTRWTSTPDRPIVADPLRLGRWVYALVSANELVGRTDIHLARFDLDSGELVQSRRLLSVDPSFRPWRMGDGIATPRGPVWAFGSNLIATDATGEARWVRRLAYTPRDVDKSLWPDHAKPSLATDGERLIVVAPGLPTVEAVDLASGRRLWTRSLPEARAVLGIAADVVVVREAHAITRLKRDDGSLIGSTPLAPNETNAVVWLNDDAMLLATSHAEEDASPRLSWLTPQTGESTKTAELPADLAYLALESIGDRLLALTLDEQRRPHILLLKSDR